MQIKSNFKNQQGRGLARQTTLLLIVKNQILKAIIYLFLAFALYSCKKSDQIINKGSLLTRYNWYPYGSELICIDSCTITTRNNQGMQQSTQQVIKIDTNFILSQCTRDSRFVFMRDGKMEITTSCNFLTTHTDTLWLIENNNLLTAEVIDDPVIYIYLYQKFPAIYGYFTNPSFSFHRATGPIKEINENYFVFNEKVMKVFYNKTTMNNDTTHILTTQVYTTYKRL